uniref:VOC domain-containing protein n=1 Tax=mine drainage metagenome TaxID=410659 RepID=E6PQP7_9ZZZZ
MSKVKAIPDGMHSLTPHLVCRNAAAAIDFYRRAFGAIERFRLPTPDGKLIHACVLIGDSQLFLFDEMPEHGALGPQALKGSPVTIHLQVQDADATFARAVDAGAKITMPLADMFWAIATARSRILSATTGRWPPMCATSARNRSRPRQQRPWAERRCANRDFNVLA